MCRPSGIIERLVLLQELGGQERSDTRRKDVDYRPGNDLIHLVFYRQHRQRHRHQRARDGCDEQATPDVDQASDTAAQNAAVNIMPSIAILNTPERSHRIPEKAPTVSGTARTTATLSKPAILGFRSDAPQARKPKMNRAETIPSTVSVLRKTTRQFVGSKQAPQKCNDVQHRLRPEYPIRNDD